MSSIDRKLERGADLKTMYEVDPLSYKVIKNLIYDWRRSGTRSSEFNRFDVPGHLFFKVVFHFWNGDAYSVDESYANHNGLLTPAWLYMSEADSQSMRSKMGDKQEQLEKDQMGDHYDPHQYLEQALRQNCAYNFLIRNDELERADLLKQFITLLSNISTYSPWYFAEVSGLDTVMERPFKSNDEYKVEDPKQITIKCMPDAQDNRVATLLDLYRSVAYSYVWHKEILPANLRKFDMSIYIFSSPIANLHSKKGAYGATMGMEDSGFRKLQSEDFWFSSYKCIELHDCEIDYNALKSGYGTLANAEGFAQEFSIPITVGDAFEQRYNPYIDRLIGDAIAIDVVRNTYSQTGAINYIFTDEEQKDNTTVLDAFKRRLYKYDSSVSGIEIDALGLIDDATGNVASNFVQSQLLGNIFKASIGDLTRDFRRLSQSVQAGNLGGVIQGGKTFQQLGNGWVYKAPPKTNIYNRSTNGVNYEDPNNFDKSNIIGESNYKNRDKFVQTNIFNR